MMRHVIAAAGLLALAACATEAPRPDDTVSVQYDGYDIDMASMQRAAEAQCRAKGYPRAVPIADAVNTASVRWNYLTFGCFSK
jgi:hypothetical protein